MQLIDVSSSSRSSSSSSSSIAMSLKKSFSMDCLSSAAVPSSSSSNSSSLVSIDEDKTAVGYLSEGLIMIPPTSNHQHQERKKGVAWTEEEHRKFLTGLEKLGKGDWRGISRKFVSTRTPTQVASHAQKYFLRLASDLNKKKRRSSLFDMIGIRSSMAAVHRHQVNGSSRQEEQPTRDESAARLHGLIDSQQLPKPSPNASSSKPLLMPPTNTILPPSDDDLELKLATPNSVEENKSSPKSLLIRVT